MGVVEYTIRYVAYLCQWSGLSTGWHLAKSTARRKTGRPRDSSRTESILEIALRLGAEVGFDGLTIEALAARSGVAKTTIYRRWPNVWAVLVDAFLAEMLQIAPPEPKGSARESFRAAMLQIARAYRGRRGRFIAQLIARAQLDANVMDALWSRFMKPRRADGVALVKRAIERGELRAGLDPNVVADAIIGPLYYRFLMVKEPPGLTDAYVGALIDIVFAGLQSDPKAT